MILNSVGEVMGLPESLPNGVSLRGELFKVERDGTVYFGSHFDGDTLEKDCQLDTLKAAYPTLTETDYRVAGKLMELLHWDGLSQFCGCCGASMERSTQISKKCPACGNEVFAPVAPAIIVLVRRGREALLVRARNFTRPNYGLVAGFVETGESLEECVRREVREETSLEVDNIRYVGSQPWPYPNSLMLGFTADYVSGEVRFADGELTDGGFFPIDRLPPLPPHPSIARALVDSWLAEAL
ncbi:MAG: NAD(+) diphosphatase [Muribaculaceae bacterium]|nr:NAD(+) diphosphatase [Muribaculaceae bacterium]